MFARVTTFYLHCMYFLCNVIRITNKLNTIIRKTSRSFSYDGFLADIILFAYFFGAGHKTNKNKKIILQESLLFADCCMCIGA